MSEILSTDDRITKWGGTKTANYPHLLHAFLSISPKGVEARPLHYNIWEDVWNLQKFDIAEYKLNLTPIFINSKLA
jgi:hypothetical protein